MEGRRLRLRRNAHLSGQDVALFPLLYLAFRFPLYWM